MHNWNALLPYGTKPETTMSDIVHRARQSSIDYFEQAVKLVRVVIKNVILRSYTNENIQIVCISGTIAISHDTKLSINVHDNTPFQPLYTTAKHKLAPTT